MIKIDLDEKTKKDIEKIFLEDAYSAPTGIFQVLNNQGVKLELKKNNTKIYNVLYDTVTGNLVEAEVEKLLLADREELKNYISMFGAYTNKKKSNYLLDNVFKYERYARRKSACQILRKMNVTVCPYCNRQYIFTIASGKVRPQLDHYYPKKIYPYLALSLYNMIPSCSICNMAKASLDTFGKDPVLYPFDEEFGYTARFEINIKGKKNFVKVMQGVSDKFIIDLDATQAKKVTEIDNQMKKLHLDELYNAHKDYVMDIIKSKNINTLERINEIRKAFPQLFHSNDEVKNMLYMTDLRKESWGKRPLSKLTYDIDTQLESGTISYVKQ